MIFFHYYLINFKITFADPGKSIINLEFVNCI